MFDPLLQDGDNDKEKKRQKEYYKTPVEESGRVKAKRQIKWEMQKVGKVKKTEWKSENYKENDKGVERVREEEKVVNRRKS